MVLTGTQAQHRGNRVVLGDVGYPRGIEMDSSVDIVMRVEAYLCARRGRRSVRLVRGEGRGVST